jgi:hypothetical protein
VDGEEAVIAVGIKTPLAGREAWVDVPTEGQKLAASRPMYRLGSVIEADKQPNTYRVHIDHAAKDPGLIDAMPIWLLLPPPQSSASGSR